VGGPEAGGEGRPEARADGYGSLPGVPCPSAPNPPPAAPAAVPARTHRWGLGAFVLVELVFVGVTALLGSVLLAPALATGTPPAWVLAVLLSVPTACAAGTALLITRLRGNGPRRDLGLVWVPNDLMFGLAFGFGGLFLTAIAGAVYLRLVGPEASSAVGDLFNGIRAGPAVAVTVFAIVVLLVPLCEEIVYRGLLWGAVERLGAGRWIAFGVTTVMFALAHFELTRTPLLLIIGIPIGLARAVTGRLLASVVAHQVNNLLPGLALMMGLLGAIHMP
jgi:membrane protease YdiL (CAAX protease family)